MKKILTGLFALVLITSCSSGKQLSVSVSNSLTADRDNEIVEISKNSVWSKLKLASHERIVVLDKTSSQVVYQIATDLSNPEDSLLIFPATVKAGGTSVYTIKKGKPEVFEPNVAGRLVPERKDDFNWENDRVAFRMYGPALQATGEISSGIDLWAKRTGKLVADKWYADELSGKSTYHNDNGEGLDFYKVGPTLGAGAAAPYQNSQLWFSKNFKDYEILDKGPLRITFRLSYESFPVDKIGDVISVRTISLDAGNQMNKIRQSFDFKAQTMPVAVGIVMRNTPGEQVFTDNSKKYAAHADPADVNNGTLYQGFTAPDSFTTLEPKNDHLLGIRLVKPQESFTYYSGGGWSKFGFDTFGDWVKYLEEFSQKLQSPLIITIN